MFYDNFTEDEIAGLFSVWHFAFIIIFAILVAAALFLCRNVNKKQAESIVLWVAVSVSVSEILKISLRVAKGGGIDSWIPLYYCSLFLYAVWMAKSRIVWLSRMGYSYITMGGVMAAFLFTLYPSTSLAIFPAWHPASIHSLLYHAVMAFVGILALWKGLFTPEKKDSMLYGAYLLLACFIGYFINEKTGSNCMFLHNAFKLPVLDDILNYSHALYMLVIGLAQAAGMFWANFAVYTLILKRKETKK